MAAMRCGYKYVADEPDIEQNTGTQCDLNVHSKTKRRHATLARTGSEGVTQQ